MEVSSYCLLPGSINRTNTRIIFSEEVDDSFISSLCSSDGLCIVRRRGLGVSALTSFGRGRGAGAGAVFRRTDRRKHSGETVMVYSVWRIFAKETDLVCDGVCCTLVRVRVRSMLLVGEETVARDDIGERVVRSLMMGGVCCIVLVVE